MKTRSLLFGATLAMLSTAGGAGIPITQTMVCPVGGKQFTITVTASCSNFGGSHDFFLKVETSCDFVTRLPQCPDNGLPMYKEFSKAEVALLKDYLKGDEYRALAGRSRFAIAKKVDDYLVSKGSVSRFGFWYVLGGLQHDREATLNDQEYMIWLREKGELELAKAAGLDAAIIRLVLAYASYRAGDFDAASTGLTAVQSDGAVKDHWLIQAYSTRLGACVQARDVNICPPEARVKPGETRSPSGSH